MGKLVGDKSLLAVTSIASVVFLKIKGLVAQVGPDNDSESSRNLSG